MAWSHTRDMLKGIPPFLFSMVPPLFPQTASWMPHWFRCFSLCRMVTSLILIEWINTKGQVLVLRRPQTLLFSYISKRLVIQQWHRHGIKEVVWERVEDLLQNKKGGLVSFYESWWHFKFCRKILCGRKYQMLSSTHNCSVSVTSCFPLNSELIQIQPNMHRWGSVEIIETLRFFVFERTKCQPRRNLRSYLVLQRPCNEAALSPGIDAFWY